MESVDRQARYTAAARRGIREYKQAFSANGPAGLGEGSEFVALAVMAVADAELAELRSEVEWAHGQTDAAVEELKAAEARLSQVCSCAANGCACGGERASVPTAELGVVFEPRKMDWGTRLRDLPPAEQERLRGDIARLSNSLAERRKDLPNGV